MRCCDVTWGGVVKCGVVLGCEVGWRGEELWSCV